MSFTHAQTAPALIRNAAPRPPTQWGFSPGRRLRSLPGAQSRFLPGRIVPSVKKAPPVRAGLSRDKHPKTRASRQLDASHHAIPANCQSFEPTCSARMRIRIYGTHEVQHSWTICRSGSRCPQLLETIEAIQDGRIDIEKINGPFCLRMAAAPLNTARASRLRSSAAGLEIRIRDLCEVHAARHRAIRLNCRLTSPQTQFWPVFCGDSSWSARYPISLLTSASTIVRISPESSRATRCPT